MLNAHVFFRATADRHPPYIGLERSLTPLEPIAGRIKAFLTMTSTPIQTLAQLFFTNFFITQARRVTNGDWVFLYIHFRRKRRNLTFGQIFLDRAVLEGPLKVFD